MNDVVPLLVGFGEALRRDGIPVGPARIRTFCEAAATLPLADLYWAGRASLVWHPEQIPIYDEAFTRYFRQTLEAGSDADDDGTQPQVVRPQILFSPDGDDGSTRSAEGTASRAEVLQAKSFADCTEAEWEELALLVSRLPQFLPLRRTRRYQRGRPGDLHVRRVLRKAAATGGEPFKLSERRRRLRVRPLIFLLDVSGSMNAYSRGLMLLAHAVVRSSPDTEVYSFATRLTNMTSALTGASLDAALHAGESLVPDWDGGTRIGDALAALLSERGRRADTRRAITVICSDGLDTGDPAVMGEQMARLRRAVHRVVWLNPLKEDPRYEPLARGMRAALPHVDLLASGHSVNSLLSVFTRIDRDRATATHRLPVPTKRTG